MRYTSGRVNRLMWVVEEMAEIGETILATTVVSRSSRRYMLKLYSLMTTALAVDLGRGTVREANGKSGHNAMRLARHLFEAEITLAYVCERPHVHVPQVFAVDARKRLLMVREVQGLRLGKAARALYENAISQAREAAEARADLAGVAVKDLPPADRVEAPSFEEMVKLLGARDSEWRESYSLYYRGASGLSHPTLHAMQHYVQVSGPRASVEAAKFDRKVAQMALVLAVRALANVLHTTGLRVGFPASRHLRPLVDFAQAPLRIRRPRAPGTS